MGDTKKLQDAQKLQDSRWQIPRGSDGSGRMLLLPLTILTSPTLYLPILTYTNLYWVVSWSDSWLSAGCQLVVSWLSCAKSPLLPLHPAERYAIIKAEKIFFDFM